MTVFIDKVSHTLKVIYPENRIVSEKTIINWAKDVWDTAPIKLDEDRPITLEESMLLLEDEGYVTFTK